MGNVIRYNLLRNNIGLECTLGVLFRFGDRVYTTLERPWKDNKKNTSCIPKGVYKVVRHNTHEYPNTWRLLNVPDREGILIHIGNYPQDTKGCILIGLEYASKTSIKYSKKALDLLNEELQKIDEWELEIL